MTKHSRLITALLALIFCFSAITVFSVPAFAESQASQGSETPGGDAPAVDPEPVYTDPITPEPEPVYTDPVTPEPVYTEPPYVDPGSGGNSGGGNSGGGNSDSGSSGSSDSSGSGTVYYDSDGDEHSEQSDEYVGGGQTPRQQLGDTLLCPPRQRTQRPVRSICRRRSELRPAGQHGSFGSSCKNRKQY